MLFFKKKFDSISVNEVKSIDKAIIIDVRTKAEFSGRHIRNAKNIEMNKLMSHPENHLRKDSTYYIVCQSGMRSKMTCKQLAKKGYHVVNLNGGMNRYV